MITITAVVTSCEFDTLETMDTLVMASCRTGAGHSAVADSLLWDLAWDLEGHADLSRTEMWARLRDVIEAGNPSADAWPALIQLGRFIGAPDTTVILARAAMEAQPDCLLPMVYHAVAVHDAGLPQEGRDLLNALAVQYPESTVIWTELARAYGTAGQYDSALVSYDRARTLDPDEFADPDSHLASERAEVARRAAGIFPPPPCPRVKRNGPLAPEQRIEVYVRVQDSVSGRYLSGRHDRHTRDCYGRWAGGVSSYPFGTHPGGWGVSFWLPPGGYAVELMSLECSHDSYYLASEHRQEFRGIAGDTVRLTFALDLYDRSLFKETAGPDRETCVAKQQ